MLGKLVTLSSLVEETSGDSVNVWLHSGWKVVENKKLKPCWLLRKPRFPICQCLSHPLLLGKPLFMVRVGDVVQIHGYPDKRPRPWSPRVCDCLLEESLCSTPHSVVPTESFTKLCSLFPGVKCLSRSKNVAFFF